MMNHFDALALSQQFQHKQLDPVRLLEQTFEKVSHTCNVFISLCQERAFREALAAKARWDAGQPLSLLDGVPLSWKDLFDINGYRTTAGSQVLADDPTKMQDADLVLKLAQVGMVSVGKTNLSEFAYSGLGLNPYFGHPQNIYDSQCIAGGSSSGAAISVGHGCVPIGMGTDTAGSIRIPAAFNGLVGFRSSHDRYSKRGVFELSKTLDTLGPLATSVRDCIALDQSILGKNSFDLPIPQGDFKSIHFVVDVRILEHSSIQPAVKSNFEKSLAKLEQAGCHIEYRPIDAFQKSLDLVDQGLWLGAAEAFTRHETLLNSPDATKIDQRIRTRLERSRGFLASEQIKLYFLQQELKQTIQKSLNGSILLTPTVAHTAPQIQPLEENEALFFETNMRTLRLTMPGSFLDMPGITLPNGFSENSLPTAILLSSFSGDDGKLLRIAHRVEEIL